MMIDTFFEKFDLFANAPNLVSKMRELVLQLAVQGKLAQQDQRDESACELVKRARKLTLADPRLAKILKAHDDGRQGEINALADLPTGWAWTCNAELGDTSPRNNADDDSVVAFAPMNRVPTDYRAQLEFESRSWREIRKGFTHFANGDVAVAKITPCFQNGKACVMANLTGGVGAGTTELHVLRPHPNTVVPLYALLFFKSPEFVAGGVATFSGTAGQQRVSNDYFRFRPVPLPPLAEQKRIVAKVDELMALCDRLEKQLQERETQHAALARAALARFAEAPTPANLEFLFHNSYAISPADLRKSILTLAVQGKLVPQDPKDEPAEELAAELERLKTQLLAGRRIRNQKVSGCPSEEDVPFEIPAGWKWVRLGHAVTILGGYAYESGAYVPTSSNQIIRLGNVKSDALLLDQKPAFIPDSLAEQTAEYAILEGDILVTMTGTKAKRDYAFTLAVKRADLGGRRLFLNQRVGAIRPFQRELVPLINVFLKSEQLLDLVFATATGTANQANIGTSSILDLPFPLPSLAEQRRIVAKVEQLMALVDALETQLAASRTTAANLLSAIVTELTRVALPLKNPPHAGPKKSERSAISLR